MQELCARHAARFAPLGITLRPWLDTLERRSYKFPGVLLAYTPANAPAVVVTAALFLCVDFLEEETMTYRAAMHLLEG